MATFSVQALSAGVLAAVVGFSSTFAVVIQGLTAVGASPAEAASGLMAVSIAMGVGAIVLSLRTRMPISVAWSTPGAAVLAASAVPEGGFAAAIGAFIVTGVLIVAAGLWRPLGRSVSAIPASLANAMLAGVLLSLCLAPVKAVAESPAIGLSLILVWAAVARFKRLYAVPAVVVLALVIVAVMTPGSFSTAAAVAPAPIALMPVFTVPAILGIALPLFLVTMASQNIPGVAVLRANGFKPAPGPLFTTTGLVTVLAAPFGAHAVNLAAITAALCAGPDAHPDPARRYWAAVVNGAAYVVVGLGAGAAAAFIGAAPPYLIEAVAGLALLGSFGGAIAGASAHADEREAAVVTFVVAASGVGFFGIGGAFWGLVAGGAVLALARWRRSA